MRVRCKIICTRIAESISGNSPAEKLHTAEFSAVYSSDPNSENGKFFKWTPSLSLSTGIIQNQQFQVGKEYYLDFVSVGDEDLGDEECAQP
jgi:hypothetical protein